MKKGGRLASASGFTIVETLIVLAVSSTLFVVAGTMISGRQAKTEFQVGSRDIQTKIQQVINETKSGYYGTESTSSCSQNGTPPPGLAFTASGALGSRGNCVFIGKALVFSGSTMYIFPLAGLRQVSGMDAPNAKAALATAIPSSSQRYVFPYGTELVGSAVDDDSLVPGIHGFAVLTSFSGTQTLGGQTFGLHAFTSSFTDEAGIETTINSEITQNDTNSYRPISKATLCIKSGGTNQSVKVTIGGDNGTAVSTEMKGNTTCAD